MAAASARAAPVLRAVSVPSLCNSLRSMPPASLIRRRASSLTCTSSHPSSSFHPFVSLRFFHRYTHRPLTLHLAFYPPHSALSQARFPLFLSSSAPARSLAVSSPRILASLTRAFASSSSFSSSSSSSTSSSSSQSSGDSKADDSKQQQEKASDEAPPRDESEVDYEMEDIMARRRRIMRRVMLSILGLGAFYLGFSMSAHGASLHTERVQPRSFVEAFTDIRDGLKDSVSAALGMSDRPLLPPPQLDQFNRKPRTLVLGFEDTLIHLDWDRYTSHVTRERPELREFLQAVMRQGWEVVLFSSKAQFEAEPAVAQVDREGIVRHRLYYEQTNMRHFHLVKDASRLGRERRRTIIVDWNAPMWEGWEANLYSLPRWEGGDKGAEDRELRRLVGVLERIVRYNIQDVREIVRRKNEGRDVSSLFDEEEELIRRAQQQLQLKQQQSRRTKLRTPEAAKDTTNAGSAEPAGASWLSSIAGFFRSRRGTKPSSVVTAEQD